MSHRNGNKGKSALSIGSRGSSRRSDRDKNQENYSSFRVQSREELNQDSEELINMKNDPSVRELLLRLEIERLQALEVARTYDCQYLEQENRKLNDQIEFQNEHIERIKNQLREEKDSHKLTKAELLEAKKGWQESTAILCPTSTVTPEPSAPIPGQQTKMDQIEDKLAVLERAYFDLKQKVESEKSTQKGSSPVQQNKAESSNDNKVFLITESNENNNDDSEDFEYHPQISPQKQEKTPPKQEPMVAQLKLNPNFKKNLPKTINIGQHKRSQTLLSEPNLTEAPLRRASKVVSEIESGFGTFRHTYSKENLEEKTPSNDNESESNEVIKFDRLQKSNIFSNQPMYLKNSLHSGFRKQGKPGGLFNAKEELGNSEAGNLTERCSSSSRNIAQVVRPFNFTIDQDASRRPSFTVHSTIGNTIEPTEYKHGLISSRHLQGSSRSQLHIDDLNNRLSSLSKFNKGNLEPPKGKYSQSGFSKLVTSNSKEQRRRLGMPSERKFYHASCHIDLFK